MNVDIELTAVLFALFLVNSLGDRNVAIVNLDPANEMLPYKPAVDIGELIRLE